jgi:hypothetical protein
MMEIFRNVGNMKIWLIEELARKSCSNCMKIVGGWPLKFY